MKYSDLSDDEILDLVIQLKQNHPNDREVMLHGHLMAMEPPVKIQRWKLRAAIPQGGNAHHRPSTVPSPSHHRPITRSTSDLCAFDLCAFDVDLVMGR